ncbi:unnamed protein product [Closterium sp. NIES-64]|nr:unnamed protein product [Closterium sp. NIES-64]
MVEVASPSLQPSSLARTSSARPCPLSFTAPPTPPPPLLQLSAKCGGEGCGVSTAIPSRLSPVAVQGGTHTGRLGGGLPGKESPGAAVVPSARSHALQLSGGEGRGSTPTLPHAPHLWPCSMREGGTTGARAGHKALRKGGSTGAKADRGIPLLTPQPPSPLSTSQQPEASWRSAWVCSQTLLTEAREYLPDVDHAVFKYFRIIKRVEGKAQQYECKFCSNVYNGAAIRCVQHFTPWKGMKRREVVLCKDAPQDVRLAMRTKYEAKAVAAKEKRRAAAEAVAAVKANGVKRARITDYLEGDAAARKREADEALALAWAALHIPERHIDHPLMVNALNLVKRAGADYVPPKRKYIGGAGLLSPHVNVLLVNDSGAVFTDSIDCNMERKTGGYVAGILRPVVEEVGPENVVAFCMDGGSNYAVAVKQLLQEWPHIQDVPCDTHALDLLMEDVGKMGWAKPVVDKGGEISSFVRNHHWTRGYLQKPELVEGKVLQALKPAGTRFGTNYIAISRLCAMHGSLTKMVTSEGWKEWAVGGRKKSCDGFSALIHDAAWWKTAEFFVALLKLPFKVMRQTDGHAVGMMGRLYDLMLQLTEDVGGLLDADEE